MSKARIFLHSIIIIIIIININCRKFLIFKNNNNYCFAFAFGLFSGTPDGKNYFRKFRTIKNKFRKYRNHPHFPTIHKYSPIFTPIHPTKSKTTPQNPHKFPTQNFLTPKTPFLPQKYQKFKLHKYSNREQKNLNTKPHPDPKSRQNAIQSLTEHVKRFHFTLTYSTIHQYAQL